MTKKTPPNRFLNSNGKRKARLEALESKSKADEESKEAEEPHHVEFRCSVVDGRALRVRHKPDYAGDLELSIEDEAEEAKWIWINETTAEALACHLIRAFNLDI